MFSRADTAPFASPSTGAFVFTVLKRSSEVPSSLSLSLSWSSSSFSSSWSSSLLLSLLLSWSSSSLSLSLSLLPPLFWLPSPISVSSSLVSLLAAWSLCSSLLTSSNWERRSFTWLLDESAASLADFNSSWSAATSLLTTAAELFWRLMDAFANKAALATAAFACSSLRSAMASAAAGLAAAALTSKYSIISLLKAVCKSLFPERRICTSSTNSRTFSSASSARTLAISSMDSKLFSRSSWCSICIRCFARNFLLSFRFASNSFSLSWFVSMVLSASCLAAVSFFVRLC
mmetsp:Transcript_36715/g.72050  ORF Transcript_36715/g.72050 Transcript_36715/m.72050 type:complete len:289 (-) Transcript_36715:847-1713(-)